MPKEATKSCETQDENYESLSVYVLIECDLIDLAYSAPPDWLKKFSHFREERSKTNTNHDLLESVFPPLTSVTSFCFEF